MWVVLAKIDEALVIKGISRRAVSTLLPHLHTYSMCFRNVPSWLSGSWDASGQTTIRDLSKIENQLLFIYLVIYLFIYLFGRVQWHLCRCHRDGAFDITLVHKRTSIWKEGMASRNWITVWKIFRLAQTKTNVASNNWNLDLFLPSIIFNDRKVNFFFCVLKSK